MKRADLCEKPFAMPFASTAYRIGPHRFHNRCPKTPRPQRPDSWFTGRAESSA
jgi:hypothetical protein